MNTSSQSPYPRRRLLVSVAGLTLASLAAACGARPTSSPTEAAAPPPGAEPAPKAATTGASTANPSAEMAAVEPDEETPGEDSPAEEMGDEDVPSADAVVDGATPSPAPATAVESQPAESVAAAPPFPRATFYDPDDLETVRARYVEDRARVEAVLAAGVPVLWVTDAIW